MLENKNIEYTIVTAIHNQLEYNKLFWESLSSTSKLSFELIIIDNASTDGSGDYFRKRGATVIRNEKNLGYSEVQNQGLKLAKTEYVAFLNNDLVLSEGWDQKLLFYMDKYKIDMISPVGIENMESKNTRKKFMRRWRRVNLLQRVKLYFGLKFNKNNLLTLVDQMYKGWNRYLKLRSEKFSYFLYPGFAGNAIVVKKSLFEKVGNWNEEVSAADFDLSLRTVRHAVRKNDISIPMVAGDVYVHHFVSATFKSSNGKSSGNAKPRWNSLKETKDIYSKRDMVYETQPKASLIIAVYNKIDALEKIFLTLINQSEKNFEIVLSDDGSSDDMASLINKYQIKFKHPIRLINHEDNGFRKTIIANRSVMAARSDYLIFIDGDMLLHHKFIERHILRAKVGHVQTGRRIMLNEKITKSLSNKQLTSAEFEKSSFWKMDLDSREANSKYGYYIPFAYNILNLTHRNYELIGCNFSLYKGDFISVNGYNQQVIGRGLEDNNLGNRFKLKGLRIDYISQEALQYHLYHTFKQIDHSEDTINKYGNPKDYWAKDGIVNLDC